MLKNLSADITTPSASIVLASMDGKPLSQSSKMLLTAGSRVASTGMQWNDTRTRVVNWGGAPTLIEPVSGAITLRNLRGATAVTATALDGAGRPLGEAMPARKTADGWLFPIGEPATTWYVVAVKRR